MVKDYQEFIDAKGVRTPSKLDQMVLGKVQKEMEPTYLKVLIKLLSIQSFVGIITLLFCPQFNFSLTNSYDVFHFIHQTFGHYICMVVCGSIFLGTGALFASLILNRYEIKTIGKSYPLYVVAVTGLAVSLFMFIGTGIYLDLTALWMLGAISSSIIFFEGGKFLKRRVIQQV